MNALRAYDGWIRAAPFTTKLASSVVIFGFCEWNSQLITAQGRGGGDPITFEERLASVDYQQVLGYISFSLFNTPLMHTYYSVSRGWSIGTRVACNSLIMDPINVAAALLINGTNKAYAAKDVAFGDALASGMAKMRSGFEDKMTTCLMVWPPIHAVNHFLVPVQYRVLGGNLGSFGWHTWLTWRLWCEEHARESGASCDADQTAAADPTVVAASAAATIVPPAPLPSSAPPPPSVVGGAEARQCPFRSTFPSYFTEPDESKCLRLKNPLAAAPVDAKPAPQGPTGGPAATEQHGGSAEAPRGSRGSGGWPLSSRPAGCDAQTPYVMTAADLEGFLGCTALVGPGGEALPVAALAGKTLALYFSASWCPPCKRFTPALAETYAAIKQARPNDENVEFVLVCLDKDAAAFDAYRSRMPWPALPFKVAQQRGPQLQAFFGAQGVPWLVTVNPDGTVANANAVRCAYADARGEHFPWEGFR